MDDEEIECINCGVRPYEVGIDVPNNICEFWYCSYECYD